MDRSRIQRDLREVSVVRLWHKDLIPYLPRQQLMGQWREVCAIARNIAVNGTPNHVLVNKVLDYGAGHLNQYAYEICAEALSRGYKVDFDRFIQHRPQPIEGCSHEEIFKDWHNARYLRQCLYNMQEKADCGAIPEEEWERITDQWPWFE